MFSNVQKEYKIRQRDEKRSKIVDFFRPHYTSKLAVDHISFSIEAGEIVGYIGANGAGKSTTIKMLTGILTPDSGQVRVFDCDPCKNRATNALKIGVVFGQRSQLLWDLPVQDTLDLFKTMYRIRQDDYVKQRDMLVDMLDMSSFLPQPVRQLSLGQRMRANLALCFLHKPEIVYLDEPTIGLDVFVKDRIRSFLKEINKEQGTTILLTTHDTQDIELVAQRLMLIDKGKLLFDGSQAAFKNNYYGNEFMLDVEFSSTVAELQDDNFRPHTIDGTKHSYWVKADMMNHGKAISHVTTRYLVSDIKVREQGLEEILKNIYAEQE